MNHKNLSSASSASSAASPLLGWDTVPMLCINLDRRPDRLAALSTQLARLGRRFDDPHVPTVRVSATDCAADGALGCSLSHLACLDRAIAENWPAVAVLEDDFACTHPAVLRRNVDAFLERATETATLHWDVLLLGANVRVSAPCFASSFGESVHRVRRAFSAVAYIVRAAYLPTLRENVAAGVQLLAGRPHLRAQYAIDVYWQRLQLRHAWFVCAPLTVTQQPGYSDIEHQTVDYADVMLRGHESSTL